VPGADPSEWHGLLEVSSIQPLFSEDERVAVSPSKLEAFENSPVDWFIDTVSGSEPSIHMAVGTILHWAMETATDPTVDAVWARVDERWNELLFEAPWLAEAQRVAMRKLATGIAEYLADFQRDGKTLVGAEKRFTLEVDRADVRGSIDRVEVNPDGGVVIVDLKTGAPITNQNDVDAHPQLGVYQLAYAQGMLDEVLADVLTDVVTETGAHHAGGAKLLFVKKGVRGKAYREGVQAPLSPEQLEGFRERIRMAAQGMAATHFDGPVELPGFGGNDSRIALRRVKAVSSD
jgi:RecB family exonuclease